ncbi:MAG: NifB/NifX family molybdenum-iron cluster-binding protein, partial [Proteobacteria bacterium]|nr:NifB/NifX family molybdenum-iron cluster-binding protein [Pseudomonadota bacterium]
MGRIAISTSGDNLEAAVDPRFGRAERFLIVDVGTNEFEVLDNSASGALSHGAGIQTAQVVANAGVEAVLSGFVGPKAVDALDAAGIKICQGATGTVREAVKDYVDGKLNSSSAPQGTPHGGGMGG